MTMPTSKFQLFSSGRWWTVIDNWQWTTFLLGNSNLWHFHVGAGWLGFGYRRLRFAFSYSLYVDELAKQVTLKTCCLIDYFSTWRSLWFVPCDFSPCPSVLVKKNSAWQSFIIMICLFLDVETLIGTPLKMFHHGQLAFLTIYIGTLLTVVFPLAFTHCLIGQSQSSGQWMTALTISPLGQGLVHAILLVLLIMGNQKMIHCVRSFQTVILSISQVRGGLFLMFLISTFEIISGPFFRVQHLTIATSATTAGCGPILTLHPPAQSPTKLQTTLVLNRGVVSTTIWIRLMPTGVSMSMETPLSRVDHSLSPYFWCGASCTWDSARSVELCLWFLARLSLFFSSSLFEWDRTWIAPTFPSSLTSLGNILEWPTRGSWLVNVASPLASFCRGFCILLQHSTHAIMPSLANSWDVLVFTLWGCSCLTSLSEGCWAIMGVTSLPLGSRIWWGFSISTCRSISSNSRFPKCGACAMDYSCFSSNWFR